MDLRDVVVVNARPAPLRRGFTWVALYALPVIGLACGSNAGFASASLDAPRTDAGSVGATMRDAGNVEDSASTMPLAGGGTAACSDDPLLPKEPVDPSVCTSLDATRTATEGTTPPSETDLDTTKLQQALNGCGAGHAVKLVASGANNAFVSGPLTLPSGVTLWVDEGVTLYATRQGSVYGSGCGTTSGSCTSFITARGTNSGIVGHGVISGQGGEPLVGQSTSWWDISASLKDSNGSAPNPALVQTSGATNFVLHGITLHDSPKFHVKLDAAGFVVWGVTIKTPATATNSVGTALTAADARNTDGIDPGQNASDGYIVCSSITTGDDQIAIKGGGSVERLTIAHDHFGSGHGMSIGSETNGGVSDVKVYDLSIDGTIGKGSSANGIRIKSNASVGGLVQNISYDDVCVRAVDAPLVLTTHYAGSTGSSIPVFRDIVIKNFHALGASSSVGVQLDGYDAAHPLGVTLDGVVVDGMRASNVAASYANVTLGAGGASFVPAGTGVAVTGPRTTPTANACAGKWVAFR